MPPTPGLRADHRLADVFLTHPAGAALLEDAGLRFVGCGHPHAGWMPVVATDAALDQVASIGWTVRRRAADVLALARAERSPTSDDALAAGDVHAAYHPWDVLHERIAAIGAEWPEQVRVQEIGRSAEGRPLLAVSIGVSSGGGTGPGAVGAATAGGDAGAGAPEVLVIAGQHAREWIAPASALRLIECLAADAAAARGAFAASGGRTPVVHVVPLVNPDGYAYSWDVDRLWRKNRRDHDDDPRDVGVDLNRNWPFAWGVLPGASSDPGSGLYHGPAPLSEPETRAVAAFAAARPGLRAMLDVHAFGQLVLSPFGHDDARADGADGWAHHDGGGAIVAAMSRAAGPRYRRLPLHDLYRATGTASDWAYAGLDVPAWTIELPDTGTEHGFLLPPSYIRPTGETLAAGVTEVARMAAAGLVARVLPHGASARLDVDVSGLARIRVRAAAIEGSSRPGDVVSAVRLRVVGRETGSERVIDAIPHPSDGTWTASWRPPAMEPVDLQVETVHADGSARVFPPAPGDSGWTTHLRAVRTVAAESFASLDAWTIDTVPTEPGTLNGAWTIGDPASARTPGCRWNDCPNLLPPEDANGDQVCLVTDLAWNCESRTVATSPPMPVDAGVAGLVLRRWFSWRGSGFFDEDDLWRLEASWDGGSTWTVLDETDHAEEGAARGEWLERRLALDVPPDGGVLRLRFTASNTGLADRMEIAVDDLRIITPAAWCAADFAGAPDGGGDGVVGLADLLTVIASWGSPGAAAGLAAPYDVTDVSDLISVLAAWGPCAD